MNYIFAILSLSYFTDAYAYLDPGTGSLIFQSLFAAVAAGAFGLKTCLQKLKMKFFPQKDTTKAKHANH